MNVSCRIICDELYFTTSRQQFMVSAGRPLAVFAKRHIFERQTYIFLIGLRGSHSRNPLLPPEIQSQ